MPITIRRKLFGQISNEHRHLQFKGFLMVPLVSQLGSYVLDFGNILTVTELGMQSLKPAQSAAGLSAISSPAPPRRRLVSPSS